MAVVTVQVIIVIIVMIVVVVVVVMPVIVMVLRYASARELGIAAGTISVEHICSIDGILDEMQRGHVANVVCIVVSKLYEYRYLLFRRYNSVAVQESSRPNRI